MLKSVEAADVFWDRFGDKFKHHPANLYRYKLVTELIKTFPNTIETVVDLGCGNGSLLRHLKDSGVGITHYGYDGSANIIKQNQIAMPDMHFGVWDLQDPSQTPMVHADLVICTEVIEHMPNDAHAFSAAKAILNRDHGVLIVTTQGGPRRRHDIQLLGHLRHYEPVTLTRELESHGFNCTHRQTAGWPFLTLQKVLASAFVGRMAEEMNSTAEPSLLFKLGSWVIGTGLRISSRKIGPQILIAATLPGSLIRT
jgi:2-polyprenyl-3-methyl-5-hydroxy-6-metoxy-1,4-benzoquinol methylase